VLCLSAAWCRGQHSSGSAPRGGQAQAIGRNQKPARVHAFLGGGGARAGRQRVATVAARVRGAIYAVASSQA